ncbi:hypothetical protein BDQ12DRAFT_727366 [Crucibulum laeve]|uniref:Ricin B lectin domain-containing protein n=1 Tax=Crucibulum laeve TaxID=68775 RepID=A0A5C3LLB2_9AGAR|nr:hypothetical protein BDQ12DRAFT_727366 [Crucibulum laeve]
MSNTVYYRLTNAFNGTSKALDTNNDRSGSVHMADTGNFSGQYWKLVPVAGSSSKFYLRNTYLGDDFSLDVINDGTNDQVHLAATGNFTGQFWTLNRISVNGTTFKLTNDFTGPNKFLDATR